MPRTGHRSAVLNDLTRLRLVVRPGHRSRKRVEPYLYRVGLVTIIGGTPSDVYLTSWTEDLDEANRDFETYMAMLEATEEDP